MKTKFGSKRAVQRRLAADHRTAHHDARALALEIGRGQPGAVLDTMSAGILLRADETAYRHLPAWLAVLHHGYWATPSPACVLVTNQRLLCRLPAGQLISLAWAGMIGLLIDLKQQSVMVDHGDGAPIMLSGVAAPVLAVGAVGFSYGTPALLSHPGLEPLRY